MDVTSLQTGFNARPYHEMPPSRAGSIAGLAEERLKAIGVAAVFGERICTFADPERFFSYRRDGETGRLLSFIQRQ